MKEFFDTNILVYAFDSAHRQKQRRASERVDSAWKHRRLTVSVQVLQEFFVVITSKIANPLSSERAEYVIHNLAQLHVVENTVGLLFAALEVRRDNRLSLWDSLIVAAALQANCSTLYTEDLQHGQKFRTVTVVNPFL